MKNDMEKYINYCTSEQTLRAQKLGAPIESGIASGRFGTEKRPFVYREPDEEIVKKTGFWNNSACWFIPTTQEMISWLRKEHNLFCGVDIDENERGCSDTHSSSYKFYKFNRCGVFAETVRHSMHIYTYEEAELAAIDSALNYLEGKYE